LPTYDHPLSAFGLLAAGAAFHARAAGDFREVSIEKVRQALYSAFGLRSNAGRLAPRSPEASIERRSGPLTVAHQGSRQRLPSASTRPRDVALGQAVNAIRAVERKIGLPPNIVSGFSGSAQVFQQALAGQGRW